MKIEFKVRARIKVRGSVTGSAGPGSDQGQDQVEDHSPVSGQKVNGWVRIFFRRAVTGLAGSGPE